MEEAGRDLLTQEQANELVLEHQGWAESIARAVARAWNLDWKLDGLDGAAMEALIFCSRRFNPKLGVPFRGYARKRIHEASTEAAKKSRGWRKALTPQNKVERQSREISAELLNIFPELREGQLPSSEGGDDDQRSAVRHLLVGASLVAARYLADEPAPDTLLDYKRMVEMLSTLDPVHQQLMYRVYWDGLSLRNLAAEWKTDGLNVIREHKTIIDYLFKHLSMKKQFLNKPKVRPGLKPKATEMKKDSDPGPFSKVFNQARGNV